MSERHGIAKVGFYFDMRSGPGSQDARRMLQQQVERVSADLPSSVAQRLAVRVEDMPVIPHQRVMANAPAPFDFAYLLSSPDSAHRPAMEAAAAELLNSCEAEIDRTNAAIFVGREIAITTGDGPVFNIMPLRRLPQLDHADFMAQWFERHASLGEGVSGVRYRQNHFAYRETEALAARMGLDFPELDGITESYFDSVDSTVEILSQESVAVDAIDDEKRFIDHDRSQFAIYETLWRVG